MRAKDILKKPGSARPSQTGSSSGPQSQSQQFVRSSLLLDNLHCPSCVTTIETALHDAFGKDILWVSPNIVTSVVVVEHLQTTKTTLRRIISVLEDSGFEIGAVQTTAARGTDDYAIARASLSDERNGGSSSARANSANSASHPPKFDIGHQPYLPSRPPTPGRRAAHLENCKVCRSGGEHKTSTACHSSLSQNTSMEKVSTEPMLEVTAAEARDSSWKLTLSVGGMTCAVCTNAISTELSKLDYVESVNVALVTNSATVIITDESYRDEVVDAIESIGYEATIDSIERITNGREETDSSPSQERTIEIRVDGMFCQHCPDRLDHALSGFGSRLKILQTPTIDHAILRVSYVPEAPHFTVRHIISAIEAADPAFTASIYHPPTLEERSKQIVAKHQRELLIRTVFSVIVAIPTFILGIVYMTLVPHENSVRKFLMKPWTSGINRLQIALFIMATPVYFYGADVFHKRCIKEIFSLWRKGSRTPILQRFYRFGSMNMLISMGTTIAYLSSVAQMIDAGVNKPHMADDHQFYFDSVVFLTMFLLIGRLIESYSKSRTGDAVEMLVKLKPSTAILVNQEAETESDSSVAVDLLELGDIVRIPHGASPPADGVIINGSTSFDESSLTGESRLIKKNVDDSVFAGTVNKDGAVLIKITGTAGASMLDQIVKIVREGQAKRAPMERIADLLTMYFVPVVVLIVIITWALWMSLGLGGVIPDSYLDHRNGWVPFALQFAVAVFVVACPCGLGLAAPTAIFVAGGLAARYGILAKGGGEAFEKASKIDCVVFDKTGTLTEGGEPKITDSLVYPGQGKSEADQLKLLSMIKAVEENSSHPVAKAIVTFCQEKVGLSKVSIQEMSEIPGRGMKAMCQLEGGETVHLIIGNESMLKDHSVAITSVISTSLDGWKTAAKSVALAAVSSDSSTWTFAAGLAVADPIRKETMPVIKALRARGTQVWMLSGDNTMTATAVAHMVGIDPANVLAEVLPSQKAEKIAYLQSTLGSTNSSEHSRGRVAMVGDGINDSPALTQADVGIAIGSGSDVAISSADFVLVTSDLRSVHTLLDLSKAVFTRIKFNFVWACMFNATAVPIAAGVLYPIVVDGKHIRLDPVWAALAMALSSITVVTSSLALRSRIPGVGFRAKKIEE
ncbi:hypothetical protein TD95_000422 [Thielaviopsis punctulata]|uniref:HMA domain-containing protein n=1 Tax=Thielaviopsis punctulata TaxID=72032 RepID=A0A0F4ZH40_9PEZI|nr:hypothetical protein TD95_000422 [Thielaviopsis punctulata]